MASSFTSIVAAKKLSAIKKNYKLNLDENEKEVSPDSRRKLEEKIAKDQGKRVKQEQKRQEQHEERDAQRERLRSRIKEKYQIGVVNEDTTTKQKKKKRNLREKDFYKYNKAMPEEQGKKVVRNGGTAGNFAQVTRKLNEDDKTVKDKVDCVIS